MHIRPSPFLYGTTVKMLREDRIMGRAGPRGARSASSTSPYITPPLSPFAHSLMALEILTTDSQPSPKPRL